MRKGVFISGATRGDGTVGEDINSESQDDTFNSPEDEIHRRLANSRFDRDTRRSLHKNRRLRRTQQAADGRRRQSLCKPEECRGRFAPPARFSNYRKETPRNILLCHGIRRSRYAGIPDTLGFSARPRKLGISGKSSHSKSRKHRRVYRVLPRR